MVEVLKVFLVDDHQILRDGLKSLIANIQSANVIGEADDGLAALEIIKYVAPDLVIMDIGMSHLNGIDATRKIKKQMPDVHVLALSMHADKQFVTEALAAGASGYILKDCAFDELETALTAIVRGAKYLSPKLRSYVAEQDKRLEIDANTALTILSPREREVLQLIVTGLTTAETGAKLHISAKTVETHRKRLMEKLGINNIAELTKYAIREGLTDV